MSVEPVNCTIKSPVPLQIGDAVSDLSRPGVYITDIILSEPVNIQEISFKNYYTAYLTVRVQRREEGRAKWVTCLKNHPLMDNPHTEAGSHDYFSIYRQQVQFGIKMRFGRSDHKGTTLNTGNEMSSVPDNVMAVRLISRQPSSEWLHFSIEEINIYPCIKEDSERDVPVWLSTLTPVEAPVDLKGLPDPETVSSSIQQMWALTEIMQANQNAASIGRFDVDGSYDVKLLSYT